MSIRFQRLDFRLRFRSTSLAIATVVLLLSTKTITRASDNHAPATSKKQETGPANHPPHQPTGASTNATSISRPDHLLVILIGGMDSDPTPRQIAGTATRKEGNSGLYRLRADLSHKLVLPEYFNWNGSRAGELSNSGSGDVGMITKFIDTHITQWPHDRVAIVGNSWGGHTAWEVLNQLQERNPRAEIRLAVFLDGSSTGRARLDRKALPTNVVESLNIYTRNSFVWGKIGAIATKLENVDLGDPSKGFLKQPGPAYDASLNFKAHVAAEWDEEIHSLIRRRLLALVPENKDEVPRKPAASETHTTPPTR